ncbi:GH36-type glycosyl hydrolase domain-containing protein [Brenneria sp. L3_3C_1]|uniref:GH36-type glycosyl hydrolase domain-containing protein n=1 Tax=Brenneria sp. L3_3C_1 TaxID=3109059 RepID=UPI0018F0AA7D|nr:glucoamylase family protein [Brenneria sp. L3-3C-1]MBJ7221291.1 glycosyl transferase [Brenneria sp. L3-3C-1]MEE3642535.1 glucoamylase family protein [Brenneria sp. L3_3C_1]
MNIFTRALIFLHKPSPPWHDIRPVRGELFGMERLEQHGRTLAAAQPVTSSPPAVLSLHHRLNDNANVLLAAYRASAAELEKGGSVVPAAEWLLDNYHLVAAQIREIREDLPPRYYQQLPKLSQGPFAGYPRVFGLVWAFIAHTDSHVDPEALRRFITAYQGVQPLTIGELWAVAITLRIVLIENLRRLADQMTAGRLARAEAEQAANNLLSAEDGQAALAKEIARHNDEPLSETFAAQLVKRLRDQDPRTTPALGWLEHRLRQQGRSMDDVVQNAQQRLGVSNVTVRNIITSMRLISDIDWATFFESVSLVDARLRAGSAFAEMDFTTRNLYRSAIEQLARQAPCTELDIAEKALLLAQQGPDASSAGDLDDRKREPGYYLIAEGRPQLEAVIGFRPELLLRFNRFTLRVGMAGYAGAIGFFTALLLAAALFVLSSPAVASAWLIFIGLICLIPFSEVATAWVNRLVACLFGAAPLAGLELLKGVPTHCRTMVVIPTLLTSEQDILQQVEQLEVHYLSGGLGDITFALLTDGVDAETERVAGDRHLLTQASQAIQRLNRHYGPGPAGDRFLLLHRRRLFNTSEKIWMGWERKRGKLHELNRLLRGAADTSFIPVDSLPINVPADVRYVITLDADTRLPRDAALKLIGKMAHPLNQPRWDAGGRRIVAGYAILQPRITPSLPAGHEGSLYQRIFSAPGGINPYEASVSDVYQDLFGEGSYTGKGIYDVDAFERALQDRIPENSLLSHDLFEGVYARSGLASDVELVEAFPTRYDVIVKRQHRWTRGDWQLLPWILGQARTNAGRAERLSTLGRWKMVDNLRRSLLAPSLLLMLFFCGVLPLSLAWKGFVMVLLVLAFPACLPAIWDVVSRCWRGLTGRQSFTQSHPFRHLFSDLKLAAMQVLLSLAFLADHSWRALDALFRTLIRLTITRRHLLEWTTAAQSGRRPRLTLAGFYYQMVGGLLLSIAVVGGSLAVAPWNWPLWLPLALLWFAAPALALWVSRERSITRQENIGESDKRSLRLIARRTWRFFETFVTAREHHLPPDNFQEQPKPVIAHRTSPTNIGLYLLSTVAARDFGWIGIAQAIERLEATFTTLDRLQRFKGHFLNWYDTRDLQTLLPAYVSSVDSGNLAGNLIVLANTCELWQEAHWAQDCRQPLADHLQLIRDSLFLHRETQGELSLLQRLGKIDALLNSSLPPERLLSEAILQLDQLLQRADTLLPRGDDEEADEPIAEPLFWINAARSMLAAHEMEHRCSVVEREALTARLQDLAVRSRRMAMEMDFAFLIDPERKLLSIGYLMTENQLDVSCYDLLASEARLASLFAIAKGDVGTRHWFRLGRAAVLTGRGAALMSWSGSMFEYLMPSLVMRAPMGSLLEQTTRLIVAHQQAYGRALSVPWGISESAYNARDIDFTYQYSNFGVPGLGLKRGLADNLVVAPYATGLATMVDPLAACQNYARLAEMGASGRYGFYEALDFTPSRLPDNKKVAIVYSFMAHHQGMTLVAIANTLHDGNMRSRFHREPVIQSCELLLQESLPAHVAIAEPQPDDVKVSGGESRNETATLRRFSAMPTGAPITHLLSNGRYAVMLTTSGSGYSRWRELAVTRWQEDTTRDSWGSFVLLRDMRSGRIWSAGEQRQLSESVGNLPVPSGIISSAIGAPAHRYDVIFGEDHASFIRHERTLTTTLDVLVSGESDGEVRRITLTNSGRRRRDIELTSYAEIVLAPPAADSAHTAFSRMFVQTEYLDEFSALIATRRPRTPDEPPVWAAHFVVLEGAIGSKMQYESDRARFIGHGKSVMTADAILGHQALSNTTGTVLDPIFSLRQRVRIPAGKTIRLAFWTVVAASRDELIDVIDKHHDRSAFERDKTFAWTQAQVQLRHLGVKAEEAADFQRLAAPVLYADPRFRAPSESIVNGAGEQSGLWSMSISGDLPIVLLRIDDIDDMAQVHQLLRAHEYWRLKLLNVDLVIVNERSSSYIQDLQIAIETAIRSSQSGPRLGVASTRGEVFALRADLMSTESRALLLSVARVSLIARRGPLSHQLALIPYVPPRPRPPHTPKVSVPDKTPQPEALEFFNGLGGFARQGREYVTVLDAEHATPAPWINVIANPTFGFQVSAQGSGYTWAENSRENQLTPWGNDAVIDPGGEALYVHDDVSGVLWTPTAWPINDGGRYVARHGFGYSRFTHHANGIELALLQFVPLADPIKISRLSLHNTSMQTRQLTVTGYAEWVLGSSRSGSAPYLLSQVDPQTGAMLVNNPWSGAFPGRVGFADLSGWQSSFTADRTEFLGRNGHMRAPAALIDGSKLSGNTAAGYDPCSALQTHISIAPGEQVEIVWLLGQSAAVEPARNLIEKYREIDLEQVLSEVEAHWQAVTGAVQVKTPDRAMDIMLNGWLLYQTLSCRIQARCGFYQASGAYGFRDQLQDGMALTFSRPQDTRSHLLRAAGRQFAEGDVQHWWLPHSGAGVRTHISDDRVWLAFATATYIQVSQDHGVLAEQVGFLEGPPVAPGEHDAFFQPMPSAESATLFEHCARGLDQCLLLTGANGLPLIGGGDWNDGMNRVGEGGKGESVWLGWLLIRTIAIFAPLADTRDAERALRWRRHAESVRLAIENSAWDGAWYRRATFDDGSWLGSRHNDECAIDSIAQSWAVLSGVADPQRAATAMASLEEHLIRRQDALALLFTPPFDRTAHDPGYIKGYPPGLRENGGQYTHAAMWSVLAFAQLGEGNKAAELFALLNPINHGSTPAQVARYRVEPYVIAADVYSVAPHVGRGGWTWYTGSAGWMYRSGVEGILGIRREGDRLLLNPCIPDDWTDFAAEITLGECHYQISVVNEHHRCRGISLAVLDEAAISIEEGKVSIALVEGDHHIRLWL